MKNRSFGRPRRKLEDNIKIDLKELDPENYTKLFYHNTWWYGGIL
jgi:hypothetical protein